MPDRNPLPEEGSDLPSIAGGGGGEETWEWEGSLSRRQPLLVRHSEHKEELRSPRLQRGLEWLIRRSGPPYSSYPLNSPISWRLPMLLFSPVSSSDALMFSYNQIESKTPFHTPRDMMMFSYN